MQNAGSVELVHRDGQQWVVFDGEIDYATSDRFDQQGLLEQVSPGTTVDIDVRSVTFIDSSGLTILLKIRNEAGSARLFGVSSALAATLAATGLASHFEMDDI